MLIVFTRFRTGFRQVFASQKPLPSKIPLTMKTEHQISFKEVDTIAVFIV